jgi:MoxR-like ATPase
VPEPLIGRTAELESVHACLAGGRHVLLEGPVGVGKTALARAVCERLERGFVRIDGDGRYTEAKLAGQFDPPLVLSHGYRTENFIAGPLVRAMREGAVLFINELNRMPEGVQNVLLPVMDERMLILPMLGEVLAAPGFAVVATQNPAEFVATGALSEALLDRFELVRLDHAAEVDERAIVSQNTIGSPSAALVAAAVALVRATRTDPRIRRGASVRAAIAIADIAVHLPEAGRSVRAAVMRAALLALPTRIELMDPHGTSIAAVLSELGERLAAPAEVDESPPKKP